MLIRILAPVMMAGIPLLMTGCLSSTDPQMSFKPPKYVEETPSREDNSLYGNLGSLYGKGNQPLFTDRKAMRVNDLVTVVISESAETSSSTNKAVSETGSLGLSSPTFTSQSGNGIVNNVANNLNSYTGIGATMDSSNSFTGSGTKDRSESFTTTVTARVIKILENGNYFIDGSREILIDGEKQIMRVNGVVRPIDIDRTNSVNSRYLADAKIFYETQGDLKRSTEKGWGLKVVDAVWPF